MKLPYYTSPANDNELLLNYQYEFKNGDKTALQRMYEKLYIIGYKTINKRSLTNPNIKKLSAGERKQKAHDAATYIIEQYLKKQDFKINEKMTGYLYKRLCWELYGEHQNKRDQMLIYTDIIPDTKETQKKYLYIVTDTRTGEREDYENAAEIFLNEKYKTLRKKNLVECINTGKKWKKYIFDLLEVDG